MKQIIQEFTAAFLITWMLFAGLSGCAVDQKDVYNMITKTKSVPNAQWKMSPRSLAAIKQKHVSVKGN